MNDTPKNAVDMKIDRKSLNFTIDMKSISSITFNLNDDREDG